MFEPVWCTVNTAVQYTVRVTAALYKQEHLYPALSQAGIQGRTNTVVIYPPVAVWNSN